MSGRPEAEPDAAARAALRAEIAAQAAEPAGPLAADLAARIAANGRGVGAVLFYGSGLWREAGPDTIFDFYVLLDGYRGYDGRRLAAGLGRLMPPNVYFRSHAMPDGSTARCKIAVMRRDQFAAAARGRALTPQIWARFAQPCRLVWARDETARAEVIDALAAATISFHRFALPLLPPEPVAAEALWAAGLAETYARELRSEPPGRGGQRIAADGAALARRTALAAPLAGWPLRWDAAGRLRAEIPAAARRRAWRAARPARLVGKLANLARLTKALITFDGAVDYALWKIERHSGVRVEPTPFQRRFPLIGGWPVLWRLYRRGAFR